MSIMRFRYHNLIDQGTIYEYSSQLNTLPASNVQNGIKAKVWKTRSGFVLTTANNSIAWESDISQDTTIPAGYYSGGTLAAAIQTALNSIDSYAINTVIYDTTTLAFTLDSHRTSTDSFSILFNNVDIKNQSLASIIGFEAFTDYTGDYSYTGAATLGNEHAIFIELTSTQTVSCFIIDGHNFSSTAYVNFAGALTSTVFELSGEPLYIGSTGTIEVSATMTVTANAMVKDFDATVIKNIRLHWFDRSKSYSEIGRLWAGTYFEPTYQRTNVISWTMKRSQERSKAMMSVAGGAYFDKRDPIDEYVFDAQPLNQYFDALTKTGYETMIDEVGNDTPFYITFEADDPGNTTVYGYFVGNFEYRRDMNTPTLLLNQLMFREQK